MVLEHAAELVVQCPESGGTCCRVEIRGVGNHRAVPKQDLCSQSRQELCLVHRAVFREATSSKTDEAKVHAVNPVKTELFLSM